MQVGGGNAENQPAGVLVNRIPRTGGNKFSGEFIACSPTSTCRARTSTPTCVARGITIPAKLIASTTSTTAAAGRS